MIRKVIVTDWQHRGSQIIYLFATNGGVVGCIWWDSCTWLASSIEDGQNTHLGYFKKQEDAKAVVIERLATLENIKLIPAGMAALR